MIPTIYTKALDIGYRSGKSTKQILSNLNLTLYPGELTALIGPNGAGKSTLLKTLSGSLKKLSGEIYFNEDLIESYTNIQLAAFRSIVTTDRQQIDHLTVKDLVAMGRYPYTNWQGKLTAQDISVIEKSIVLTGLDTLREKWINELSDGERQKTFIARALAQSTKVIILDEPTAFLDLPNKIRVMSILKRIASLEGKSVLMSTHDLDLALLLSDKLWLMNSLSIQAGVPEDLVLEGAMRETFKDENFYFDEGNGKFVFDLNKKMYANVEGDGIGKYWLKRALERKGYNVNGTDAAQINVFCTESNGKLKWILKEKNNLSEHDSIQSLLLALKD